MPTIAHPTALECLLVDIVEYLDDNPTAVNTELAAFIINKYGFTSEQTLDFFGVLGTVLVDTGISDGPLIADMHVAIQRLGRTKAVNLVGFVAAGMQADPQLIDEMHTLMLWQQKGRISEAEADILTLDNAILQQSPGAIKTALQLGRDRLRSDLERLRLYLNA